MNTEKRVPPFACLYESPFAAADPFKLDIERWALNPFFPPSRSAFDVRRLAFPSPFLIVHRRFCLSLPAKWLHDDGL
jgi:hypothetical protein